MTAAGASGRSEPGRAFVLGHLGACALFWGSSFLIIKLMDGTLSPWAIAASRGVLGAAALALWLISLGQKPWPARSEIKDWIILGTSNGWVPNVLVAYALTRLDSGPAAMIQSAGALVTAVLAHVFFAEERLTASRLLGIAIGLVGVALIIGPSAFGGHAEPLAVLAMVGVMLGYAVGNLYARAIPGADPARLALGQQMVSGTVATGLAFVFSGVGAFATVPQNLLPVLALGIFATALPMAVFMKLICAAGPTRASLTSYLVPTVAVILGVVVLGERLEFSQLLGGIIVLSGIGLVTGPGRPAAERAA